MSTTYKLLQIGSSRLEITESSSKLSLEWWVENSTEESHEIDVTIFSGLDPQTMVDMLLDGIRVCSYHTDVGIIEKKIETLLALTTYKRRKNPK